jgi:exonuclease SbcC
MRLDTVRMRGIGPFRDEVTLDLSELGDARIVAVCGDNGEGKTAFLEFALPGALYRRTPTQGSLRDRATARDSLLEVGVTGAERYTIRHLVDGVSGKSESVVLDDAGRPVSGSTKVSDFDAFAARAFPVEELLLAGQFGAQQDAGFLGASPSERKAILLRALGIARYEAWAAAAGERARSSKQALDVTRARLEEARRTGGDVTALEASLATTKAEATRLDGELARAREALAALEEQARIADAAAAARAAHEARQSELTARLRTFELKLQDIEARIGACNRTLAQEGAIRDAASKLDAVREQLAELEQQRAALLATEQATRERRRSATAQAEEARGHFARVSTRLAELEQLVAKGADIAQAAVELRQLEEALGALREAVKAARGALDALSAAAVAGAEERIVGLRRGLEAIAYEDGISEAHVAVETLKADDATVAAAAERPARLAAARQVVDDAQARLGSAERRQQQLSALARRAGEVTAAKDQVAALKAERAQHAEAERRAEALATEATRELARFEQSIAAVEETRRAATAQAEALQPLAYQLPNIALAASKLEERKAQKAELDAEIAEATRALKALGPAPAAPAAPALQPHRQAVDELERRARTAHQAAAVAASQLERALGVAEQVRALEAQRELEEAELADWTRLADDLGRKGLQAAEIDGVGPELTTLVNDLLHRTHGPRFTVRIDTQQPSADGKKTIEGCWVTVIDTVAGREDEGQRFSGGERVIIGEACALGLSLLACQRSGVRGITLVRDETGAALDPGNAEVYLEMLRLAADQVDADRVLFVCHRAEVAELADARITVAGGKLVIDAPAGRIAA